MILDPLTNVGIPVVWVTVLSALMPVTIELGGRLRNLVPVSALLLKAYLGITPVLRALKWVPTLAILLGQHHLVTLCSTTHLCHLCSLLTLRIHKSSPLLAWRVGVWLFRALRSVVRGVVVVLGLHGDALCAHKWVSH